MYLQIPNYLGFNGIAILPHVDAPDATCYVLGDKSEMFFLENSSTYVPYFPGHYYFLYKNMRMNERTVDYFENENSMNTFLVSLYGKLPVVSHFLNISVGKEWVPHMTPLIKNHKIKDAENVSDFVPHLTNTSDAVCEKVLEEILLSATVDKSEICENILDELLESAIWKSENRCNLCFVSHFPWMKICKRVKRNTQKIEVLENENSDDLLLNVSNKNKERQVSDSAEKECLKLRGGANGPKHLSIEHDKVGRLLTIFRSLDLFANHMGHDKCPLPEKEINISNLCLYCLVRSLVLRANSLKGRNQIIPVEILGEDLEYLQSVPEKLGIQYLLNDMFESAILEERFWSTWDCYACFENRFELYYEFSDPGAAGRDVMDLLTRLETYFDTKHSEHMDFKEANKDATVLFFACDYGVLVDLSKFLQFGSKTWRCKSVLSKTCNLFYCNGIYYSVDVSENRVFTD